MNSYWAVVMSRPNEELRACKNLARQGFEYYFPRFKKQNRGNNHEIVLPLFSRYLFLKIINHWYSVLGTGGVSKILLSGDGEPSRLPSDFVSRLKSSEDQNGFIRFKEEKFKKGQKLRITSGPWENEIVIYQHSTVQERELVLLNILGRMVPTSVDGAALAE